MYSQKETRKLSSILKEACEAMGVRQCSVASCYRRGYRCKGYIITKMDLEEPE